MIGHWGFLSYSWPNDNEMRAQKGVSRIKQCGKRSQENYELHSIVLPRFHCCLILKFQFLMCHRVQYRMCLLHDFPAKSGSQHLNMHGVNADIQTHRHTCTLYIVEQHGKWAMTALHTTQWIRLFFHFSSVFPCFYQLLLYSQVCIYKFLIDFRKTMRKNSKKMPDCHSHSASNLTRNKSICTSEKLTDFVSNVEEISIVIRNGYL